MIAAPLILGTFCSIVTADQMVNLYAGGVVSQREACITKLISAVYLEQVAKLGSMRLHDIDPEQYTPSYRDTLLYFSCSDEVRRVVELFATEALTDIPTARLRECVRYYRKIPAIRRYLRYQFYQHDDEPGRAAQQTIRSVEKRFEDVLRPLYGRIRHKFPETVEAAHFITVCREAAERCKGESERIVS